MKRPILLAAMLVITHAFASTQITSYNINAKLNPGDITVTATLIFLTNEQPDNLVLLFSSDSKILSIKNAVNEQAFDLNYSRSGKDTLLVQISENMKEAGNFLITFDYEYPLGEDSVILLDRGHRWYPMIAEDIFPFTMTVEVPRNYLVISAGNIINERTIEGLKQVSFDSRQPVFKIPLIIAPESCYKLHESNCGKFKSCFYQLSKSAGNLDSVNADICSLINYFSNKIGEYPYERFTLVETSAFPGSNLGTSIVTTGTENLESYKNGNKDWLNMAVASQWMGAGVFPRLFSKGFWFLSISFPHYLRLMYEKDTGGEEVFKKEIDHLVDTYKKIEGTEGDISILDVDYPNTKEKGILLYAKGVIVLDKLKNQIGEDNWAMLLKYFYSEYGGKTIILDDFLRSINKFDTTGSCSKSLLTMLSTKGMPE